MTEAPEHRTLECVVCGTASGPEAHHCPVCREPRTRWCECLTLVTLAQRECPSCARVIPRVVDPAKRRRERIRRRLVVAGVGAAVLGGAAVFVLPLLSDARRIRERWREGEEALGDERWGTAVAALSEVQRALGDDPRLLRELGEAHLGLGQADAARAVLGRALALDPGNSRTLLVLARLHLAAGEPRQALLHLEATDAPEARAVRARVLAALGRHGAAAATYDRALEGRLDPAGTRPRTPPRDDLAFGLEAAEIHRRLGALDLADAATHTKHAREIAGRVATTARARLAARPDDAESAAALALAATGHDGTLPDEQVDDAARGALRLAPHRTDVRVSFARWLSRRGRKDDAVAVLSAEFVAPDAAEWRIERARALAACGEADRATAELRAAARDAGDRAGPALAALARVLLDAGRAAEARSTAEAALLRTAAGDVALLEVAADAAAAAGDRATAAAQYRAWAEAAPRSAAPLRKLVALGFEGLLARVRAGAPAEDEDRGTRAALAQLGRLDPEDGEFLRCEAFLDDAEGRSTEADRALELLLERCPEDAAARALRIRRACDGTSAAASPASIAKELVVAAARSDVEAFAAHGTAHGHGIHVLSVLREALRRSPGDAAIVLLRARALLAIGRAADAAQELADGGAAMRAVPGAAGLHATALVLAGRDDEAAALVARLSGRDADDAASALVLAGLPAPPVGAAGPDDPPPQELLSRAAVLQDLGSHESARDAWARAVAKTPDDARAAALRVAALLDGERTTEDAREARALVERLRGRAPAEHAFAAGLLVAEEGDVRVAVEIVGRAVAADPRFAEARAALARLRLRAGDVEGALRDFRVVLRERPTSLRVRRDLVGALFADAARRIAARDLAGAWTACAEAARTSPAAGRDPDSDAGLGRASFPMPRDAATFTRACAEARSSDLAGLLLVGAALHAEGRRDEAESAFAAASAAEPENPAPRLVRAAARADAGDAEGALADVAATVPESAGRGEEGLVRACAHLVAGRAEAALDAAQGAVASAPRDARARRIRAAALLTMRQDARAAEDLLAAYDAGGGGTGLVVGTARRLVARGQAREALAALERLGRGIGEAEDLRGAAEAALRR